MPSQPSFYRFVGESLFREVSDLLRVGRHIALIGPRNGGKALVLAEVKELLTKTSEQARTEIVRLTHRSLGDAGGEQFCVALARELGVRAPSKQRIRGARLAGVITDLLVASVVKRKHPLWIFVQDVLGFSTPIARELLTAFQQ